MIAFGCVTTDDDEFRLGAAQTIGNFVERNSLLLRRHGFDSAARPFNEMAAKAAEYEDLEALVLLAQDALIEDPDFLLKVRELFGTSEEIAMIGVGATVGAREAESLEGGLAVLSPWAARELRCDEQIVGPIEPCIADLSREARARGRRVLAGGIWVERCSRGPLRGEHERAVAGAAALRRKWGDDLLPRRI